MKNHAQRRIIIIGAIGFVIVVLGASGRLGVFSNTLNVVFAPISRTLHSFGSSIAREFGVVGSARDLAEDNAQLRKENADLRAALATASAGASELAAIKRELGIRQVAGKRLVPADVTSTQPDSYRAFITINRGSTDGLAVGMAVVSNGTLVGTINQVSSVSSKVLLVTDPSFKVNGQVVARDNGASGTVRGSIGGGLLMEKVPQDQTIAVGDTVITSGLGGDIIKGYSIGTIQSITKADNGVFQSARLQSPVQISRLQTVFVVAN